MNMPLKEAIRLTRKQMGVIMSDKYPDEQICEYHDGSGAQYVKAQTYADRIRAMTDEELCAAIFQITYATDITLWFCKEKKECEELMNADKDIPDEMCKACLLEKLRQPIEETKRIVGFHMDKEESGLFEED